jgi:hypothetical protein
VLRARSSVLGAGRTQAVRGGGTGQRHSPDSKIDPLTGPFLDPIALIYLATAVLYILVTRLAVGERARAFKAVSPGMLPPLAIIFALLVGFLAAQVWSDADRAHTAVNRKASALRAVVLLGAGFPGETDARLRDLIRNHIQDTVSNEWPAMGRRSATLSLAPAPLADALRLALTIAPKDDGQTAAQRAMIEALQTALDARRQRIILSGSSVNWVKWMVLLVQAALTLLTIALIHSDNLVPCRIILTIFATSVGMAVVLIAAHSRPFTGELSVSPAVLLQVMPEAGQAAGS